MNKPSNPPFASKLSPMCNAWIFLNEDEPSGTNYNSPHSAFQRMISDGLYQASDIINLCFVDIVPTGSNTIPAGDGSSYTLFIDKVTHPPDKDGNVPTNQDYMEWIIRDAKKANPKTAPEAYEQMQTYGFKAVTTWRLNSQNYIFEQDQQLALSKLVKGK